MKVLIFVPPPEGSPVLQEARDMGTGGVGGLKQGLGG